MKEIAICYASLHDLQRDGVQFIFTDRHGYLEAAQAFSNVAALKEIDWGILQRRDFKRDPDDLGKVERYEAEALVRTLLPVKNIRGIACCNASEAQSIRANVARRGLSLAVEIKPSWYF